MKRPVLFLSLAVLLCFVAVILQFLAGRSELAINIFLTGGATYLVIFGIFAERVRSHHQSREEEPRWNDARSPVHSGRRPLIFHQATTTTGAGEKMPVPVPHFVMICCVAACIGAIIGGIGGFLLSFKFIEAAFIAAAACCGLIAGHLGRYCLPDRDPSASERR